MSEEVEWTPLATDLGYYCPLKAGSIDGTDQVPHDRAIVRAKNEKYKLSKDVSGNPESTVFVSRLNHTTTEDMLKDVFSKYGKIESCRLVRDIVTGRSKGYAFIEFNHKEDAKEAYYGCHKMYLDGAQIVVDFECERLLPGWVPRRLGGGFGGKKESGQLRFGGRDRPFKKPIVLGSVPLGSRRSQDGVSGSRYHSLDREDRRRERDYKERRDNHGHWRRRDSDYGRYSDTRHTTKKRHI